MTRTDVLAEALLARSADAVFLLDVTTGRAIHRWYDRSQSQLDLPDVPESGQLVSWIHPDDLPAVLETYASVVHGGAATSTFARAHPDRGVPRNSALLVAMTDVRDLHEDGILVQAWLIHADSVVSPDLDASTSLSSLAAAAPVGLQVLSASGLVSFENERFTTLAAPGPEVVEAAIRRAIAVGVESTEDLRLGGTSLRLRVVPTHDGERRLTVAVASLEDVTHVLDAEYRRSVAEEQFAALFFSSPLATALVALDGRIVRANESFSVITGYPLAQLCGTRFQDITHPDDLAIDEGLLGEVLAGTRPSYQMEKRYIHASGHDVWVSLTVAPVRGPDGSIQNLVTHVEDITGRRSISELYGGDEASLTYWATHDHLTALPNRRYLEHQLGRSLQKLHGERRAGDVPVVLFIDLDDFKPVNDRFGHQVGDEVLQEVSRRLRNACRDDLMVARYGGDEFVVVARRLRSAAEIPLLVERIQSAVQSPITCGDAAMPTIEVGASIGIAVARPDDTTERLLGRADKAAYRAKRAGKGRASEFSDIDPTDVPS